MTSVPRDLTNERPQMIGHYSQVPEDRTPPAPGVSLVQANVPRHLVA